MNTGDKLYITVCTSDENNEVCSPAPFKTKEEAVKDVENWYNLTMDEYYEYHCSGDCSNGFAYIEHNGCIETCQMIEVVIP